VLVRRANPRANVQREPDIEGPFSLVQRPN
jgi:hypothetical protein